MACGCFTCTKERTDADPGELIFGRPRAMMRMFLCETCGNKRCPGAKDHRNACTGSNDPDQKGSLYA